MSTADNTSATIALLTLESAVSTAYTVLRDVGLGTDPARDAILGQVADTITTAAYEIDGVPIPTDDDGEGGVRTR